MTSASRRTGTTWENAVRDLLRNIWPHVERAPRWGSKDKGDMVGTGPFVVEAKACKTIDLAGFVDEAIEEASNAGRPYPVVFIKRRRKPAKDCYVVMPAHAWLDMIEGYENSHR